IANSDVPILMAAGDIAARSQALAANAPNLAAAESHFARLAISLALHKQLDGLAQVGERLRTLAPNTQGLDQLIHNQALLARNLERLDSLVGDRIDADSSAANLTLVLRGWLLASTKPVRANYRPLCRPRRREKLKLSSVGWLRAMRPLPSCCQRP